MRWFSATCLWSLTLKRLKNRAVLNAAFCYLPERLKHLLNTTRQTWKLLLLLAFKSFLPVLAPFSSSGTINWLESSFNVKKKKKQSRLGPSVVFIMESCWCSAKKSVCLSIIACGRPPPPPPPPEWWRHRSQCTAPTHWIHTFQV